MGCSPTTPTRPSRRAGTDTRLITRGGAARCAPPRPSRGLRKRIRSTDRPPRCFSRARSRRRPSAPWLPLLASPLPGRTPYVRFEGIGLGTQPFKRRRSFRFEQYLRDSFAGLVARPVAAFPSGLPRDHRRRNDGGPSGATSTSTSPNLWPPQTSSADGRPWTGGTPSTTAAAEPHRALRASLGAPRTGSSHRMPAQLALQSRA